MPIRSLLSPWGPGRAVRWVAVALLVSAAMGVGIGGPVAAAPGRPAAPGDQLWASKYTGAGVDVANDVMVSANGTLAYVTGVGNSDYVTIAYRANSGRRLWLSRYDGPGHRGDGANALALSPDGTKLFVTGNSDGGPGAQDDLATVAIDTATGRKLWVARYNGIDNNYDAGFDVAVSPDGSVVFTTGYTIEQGDYDFITVANDAITGARLWATAYNGPGNFFDAAYGIVVSPDGAVVYVAGWSYGLKQYDFGTVAYDAATGQQVWEARYENGTTADFACCIRLSPEGTRVFVTGWSETGIGNDDWATVAYDAATGAQQWLDVYDGPGHGNDYIGDLAVGPDGSLVFVTGTSYDGPNPAGQSNYATVAYDAATGTRVWVSKYDGVRHFNEAACCVAVNPAGTTVYVTGTTQTPETDFATVALDAASGAQIWATVYDGGDGIINLPGAIAVNGTGTGVFVTGQTNDGATGQDYATVAYRG